jgi:sacsin
VVLVPLLLTSQDFIIQIPMQGTTGWEDFGQKVDLTARIRELLNDYPAGTAILSELLQNADDAKAREFKLCLDHRTHGMDSLPSAKLQQFQGPALLAYNSACFTARDFESIQRIGDSLKKESTDGGHTGRFGVSMSMS